jgi:hypothetical protein
MLNNLPRSNFQDRKKIRIRTRIRVSKWGYVKTTAEQMPTRGTAPCQKWASCTRTGQASASAVSVCAYILPQCARWCVSCKSHAALPCCGNPQTRVRAQPLRATRAPSRWRWQLAVYSCTGPCSRPTSLNRGLGDPRPSKHKHKALMHTTSLSDQPPREHTQPPAAADRPAPPPTL